MTTTTVTAMQAKFPEFATLTPAAIGFALEEGQLYVGDGSTFVNQANAQLACMLYSAHVLAVGLMTAESGTGQIATSESIAGLGSTSFATVGLTPGACDLECTAYGRRLLDLLKRNMGGAYVI